jgi:UDP-2,3-diacylglucosamine pyrophosphatase LpxH
MPIPSSLLFSKKFIIFIIVFILFILLGSVFIIINNHQPTIIETNDVNKNIYDDKIEEVPEVIFDLPKDTITNDDIQSTKIKNEIKQENNVPNNINNTTSNNQPVYKPFVFSVIADSENYQTASRHNVELEEMLNQVKSHQTNFTIFTGDLVADPQASTLTDLKKLIDKYLPKYYLTFGKHDIECGNVCVDNWKKIFFNFQPTSDKERYLYYSFDYENTHFILLSTDYPLKHSIDDLQLAWLSADLAKTDKENIIVISHVPPVNFFKKSKKECHDMSCNSEQRDKLMQLFKRYKVDLVIAGHEHVFDHKIIDNIDFILAGNTGNGKRYKNSTWDNIFSLISISGNHITLKAIDIDGKLIREIPIK